MDIRNRQGLKEAAGRSLAGASCDPRKLILIHTGASLILSVLATGLDFLLSTQIADTGGLGGLGLRSMLSTVQSVLRLLNLVVLPFWEAGYIFTAMGLARGKDPQTGSLLEGFRRWGPILRAYLLQMAIYMGIAIVCFYVALQIFLVTPLAAPLYEILDPYLTTTVPMDDAVMTAATDACMPMVWIFAALYALVALPFIYRYRMVDYVILDDPKAGAFGALRESRRLTRGNRFSLFRLDLSFWWFYLAQALLTVVCYGDVILALLGITLPFSEEVSFFLFYLLSMGLQLVLYVRCRNRVAVTYAHAYDALRTPREEVKSAVPQNLPWNNV